MEGQSSISPDVLASYAADAAREVEGVQGLVEGPLPRHKGVRVAWADDAAVLELHLAVEQGWDVAEVAKSVQERVAEFLLRMADTRPSSIDVVVDEIRPAAAVEV